MFNDKLFLNVLIINFYELRNHNHQVLLTFIKYLTILMFVKRLKILYKKEIKNKTAKPEHIVEKIIDVTIYFVIKFKEFKKIIIHKFIILFN